MKLQGILCHGFLQAKKQSRVLTCILHHNCLLVLLTWFFDTTCCQWTQYPVFLTGPLSFVFFFSPLLWTASTQTDSGILLQVPFLHCIAGIKILLWYYICAQIREQTVVEGCLRARSDLLPTVLCTNVWELSCVWTGLHVHLKIATMLFQQWLPDLQVARNKKACLIGRDLFAVYM